MGGLIGFVVIMSIWGYCYFTQRPADLKRKELYLDRAREYSMKGQVDMADKYYDLASRIK